MENYTMTSRERVYRTLEFRGPDRAPRQLWALPWARTNYPEMIDKINRDFEWDMVSAPAVYAERPVTSGDQYKPGTYIDDWGCVFENIQDGVIGEVKNPIVTGENWEDFGKVRIPREYLTFGAESVNAFCAATDKFVLMPITPRPFEQMQFLRGTEQLFIDLATGNEGMKRAVAEIHAFYCELMERWARTDVDALSIMDDWGTQWNLLINPAMWREIFLPLYRDYISIAHARGKKIFMHSDGHILQILGDLVDAGLDAINSQIFCMGLDNLQKYAGKITFWGEIDRQWILPYWTGDEVASAVRQVYEKLWRDGGCIAQCEFGIGANPENVYAVFEAWDKVMRIV